MKGRVIYLSATERRALLRVMQPEDRIVDRDTHELILYADDLQTQEALRVRVEEVQRG